MNKMLIFLFCSFSILTSGYCEDNNDNGKMTFLLAAKDASLDKQSGNKYTFTLYHADKTLTYFSASQKKTGKILLKTFLDSWGTNFKTDPPNAAIVTYSQHLSSSKIPVILENPKYYHEQDRLIFTITLLVSMEHLEEVNLGEVVLFIDTAPIPLVLQR